MFVSVIDLFILAHPDPTGSLGRQVFRSFYDTVCPVSRVVMLYPGGYVKAEQLSRPIDFIHTRVSGVGFYRPRRGSRDSE